MRDGLLILGAGPAGLAAGYYAVKNGLSPLIVEAANRWGGNAYTLAFDGFLYDTGAHRIHDKIPEVTAEIELLLGDDLLEVDLPSYIIDNGRRLKFPPTLVEIFSHLGIGRSLKSVMEILSGNWTKDSEPVSFYDYAIQRYGKSLADKILINYSEKLWGISTRELSPLISGNRLQGIGFKTLLHTMLRRAIQDPQFLEGRFLYPRFGMGQLMDQLAKKTGTNRIRLNEKVIRLHHRNNRITHVETNKDVCSPDKVISTLPINVMVDLLSPPAPASIRGLVQRLKFRQLRLLVLKVKSAGITGAGSLYFPDRHIPFTRIYEPAMRSPWMNPADGSLLVIEFPCFKDDRIWQICDETFYHEALPHIEQTGIIHKDDVTAFRSVRLFNAYPVLELQVPSILNSVTNHLNRLENLNLIGRNAKFQYIHIHQLMYNACKCIEDLSASQQRRTKLCGYVG